MDGVTTEVEMKQWYMEYKIHKNRPGLLGDIASLMGMMNINILTINGVEDRTRGMPRVGKTESIIAGSVCANKRWTFVSSTLLRQTVRSQLSEDEFNPNNVFIIDGIVNTIRSNEKHHSLLQEIMEMPSTKVVEHPDIFVKESGFDYNRFDYIIELRNTPDEEISYETFTINYEGF